MTTQSWILIGVALAGWVGSFIALIWRIAVFQEKVRRLEKDFHDHEKSNEIQFENYHIDMKTEMEKVFQAIDGLRNTILDLAIKGVFKKE